MQDKAQQGKHDPMPTPERELERYGVWVKAEPQDVIEDTSPDSQLLDAESDDIVDSIPLSSEEEALLESFDLPDETDDENDESSDIDEFDILEPLEENDGSPGFPKIEDQESSDFDTTMLEGSIIDVPIEDLDFDKPDAPQSQRTASLGSDAPATDDFSTVEVNMDDFDFEDAASAAPSLEAIGSIEPSSSSPETGKNTGDAIDEFESIDIDLQFDDTIPSTGDSEIFMEENEDLLETSTDFETVDLDSMELDSTEPDS
jgi:hypothetical protein